MAGAAPVRGADPDRKRKAEHSMQRRKDRPGFVGYLLRFLLLLLVIAGLTFLAFAYLGDLEVPREPRSLPVELGTG
jgi:hypothetical protein